MVKRIPGSFSLSQSKITLHGIHISVVTIERYYWVKFWSEASYMWFLTSYMESLRKIPGCCGAMWREYVVKEGNIHDHIFSSRLSFKGHKCSDMAGVFDLELHDTPEGDEEISDDESFFDPDDQVRKSSQCRCVYFIAKVWLSFGNCHCLVFNPWFNHSLIICGILVTSGHWWIYLWETTSWWQEIHVLKISDITEAKDGGITFTHGQSVFYLFLPLMIFFFNYLNISDWENLFYMYVKVYKKIWECSGLQHAALKDTHLFHWWVY